MLLHLRTTTTSFPMSMPQWSVVLARHPSVLDNVQESYSSASNGVVNVVTLNSSPSTLSTLILSIYPYSPVGQLACTAKVDLYTTQPHKWLRSNSYIDPGTYQIPTETSLQFSHSDVHAFTGAVVSDTASSSRNSHHRASLTSRMVSLYFVDDVVSCWQEPIDGKLETNVDRPSG